MPAGLIFHPYFAIQHSKPHFSTHKQRMSVVIFNYVFFQSDTLSHIQCDRGSLKPWPEFQAGFKSMAGRSTAHWSLYQGRGVGGAFLANTIECWTSQRIVIKAESECLTICKVLVHVFLPSKLLFFILCSYEIRLISSFIQEVRSTFGAILLVLFDMPLRIKHYYLQENRAWNF